MRGLSPVAASGGHSSSRCAGLSLSRPLLLRSRGSRRAGSVVVAHGPSCSTACGIIPDQGSNPCPLHWQADSQPLRHQGSPPAVNFNRTLKGTFRSNSFCFFAFFLTGELSFSMCTGQKSINIGRIGASSYHGLTPAASSRVTA